MITIGITGFSGGKLMEMCKYNAHVNSDMYETAEDIHSIFGHFLAIWLREKTN
jgi:D-sedoheptulose 7-phosphate isomerase